MKPLVAALLVASAVAALAAPREPPRPADAAQAAKDQEARSRYAKGIELYRQARYREAITEFEAAYKLKPHGNIYFNLAQCHERLGDIPAALQAYHEYLRAVPDAPDRSTVLAAMDNLGRRIGASGVQQLLVYTDPSGAEVLVDGQSKGRSPLALVLPHGAHVVTLIKAGYRTTTRQAVLSPQASVEIDVAMQKLEVGERVPLPPPPPTLVPSTPPQALTPPRPAPGSATAPAPARPPPGPPPRLWTWVAAGAAGAALAGGMYYGMSARSAESDLKNSTHDGGTARQLADKAKSHARNANILYGVGAVAGAGAVTLFFVEGSF